MPDFYSIQDILSLAVRLEQASQEFYRQLSQTSQNQPVIRFLETLLIEEQAHEAKLLKLINEQGAVLEKSIGADEIHGYIRAIETPESPDYKAAVKLAMDKEKAAEMLYSVLAGLVEDQSLKQMLLRLSRQEQMHKQFFEKEYHRICLSEN
ncbi:MAG: ferritin family protein [Planctomycetota bacterium]|jgi:rubrerythrin